VLFRVFRQQVRTYHEVLAQMSCLPSPQNATENKKGCSPSSIARSSAPAATLASAKEEEAAAGDDREDKEREEDEDQEDDEEQQDERPTEETREKVRALQEEIFESVCSAAAAAAASAALTATEAAYRSWQTSQTSSLQSSFSQSASGSGGSSGDSRPRNAPEWSADVGAVAAAAAVALYEDRTLAEKLRALVEQMVALQLSTRRKRKCSLRKALWAAHDGGRSPGEAASRPERTNERKGRTDRAAERPGESTEDSEGSVPGSTTASNTSAHLRCSGGCVSVEQREETLRLLEKIQKQQFELDRLRDTNDRQGKQLLQLTLQLTALKTEAEERSLQEREREEEREARAREEEERKARAREEEERKARAREEERSGGGLSADHERELEELAAAAAECFDLKCHLQDLARTCSQASDRQRVLEEEVASLRRALDARDAKLEELSQLSRAASPKETAAAVSSEAEAFQDCTAGEGGGRDEERELSRKKLTTVVSVGVQATVEVEESGSRVETRTRSSMVEAASNSRLSSPCRVQEEEGTEGEEGERTHNRENKENVEDKATKGKDPDFVEVPTAKDAHAATLCRTAEQGGDEKEELMRKVKLLEFELDSLKARDSCERRRQQQQLQDLKRLCVKEKAKREKAEAECQRLMAEALEQQVLELHQRQQSVGEDAFPESSYRYSRSNASPSSRQRLSPPSPCGVRRQEAGARDACSPQAGLHRGTGDSSPLWGVAKREATLDSAERQKGTEASQDISPDSTPASQAALRELHDAYESLKEEFNQLSVAQTLLQDDVTRKAEIIAFLVKKYALKEETFRGPVPASSSSSGWKRLAAAAAEAVGGAGHSSLSVEEMQKMVEETLLENIRLRTDLATLADDFERILKAQGASPEDKGSLPASPHPSSAAPTPGHGDRHRASPMQEENSSGNSHAKKGGQSERTTLINGMDLQSSAEAERERGEEAKRPPGVLKENEVPVTLASGERSRALTSEGMAHSDSSLKKGEQEEKGKKMVLLSSGCTRLTSRTSQTDKAGVCGTGVDRSADEGCSPLSDSEACSEVVLFRADA
ncbi:hypothetical protein TGVAND_291620B, partial [Toxoplasma gondii VAND]